MSELSITINASDSDSIVEALRCGITTPELLWGWLDDNDIPCELVENCLVLDVNDWYADDGNAEMLCEGAADGETACRQYVDEGDWDDGDGNRSTSWVNVVAYRRGLSFDGDLLQVDEHSMDVEIDPTEPDCTDSEHDWQSPYRIVGGCKENPGVHGKGGGAIYREACVKCGCGKVTDTWAHNPSTGEQGLTTVKYSPDEYVDEIVNETD